MQTFGLVIALLCVFAVVGTMVASVLMVLLGISTHDERA